jgi:hypothetical protein
MVNGGLEVVKSISSQPDDPEIESARTTTRHLPTWKVMAILATLESEKMMTDHWERPTPQEAATALDSIARMKRVALNHGLRPRWFAGLFSLWVGAMTIAKAYDGPAVDGGIAALLVGGVLGLALWRRRIVARVRAVHSAVGNVAAVAMIVGVLVILVVGDRAFESHDVWWAPMATGGAVAAMLFVAFELARRKTQAKVAAGDA